MWARDTVMHEIAGFVESRHPAEGRDPWPRHQASHPSQQASPSTDEKPDPLFFPEINDTCKRVRNVIRSSSMDPGADASAPYVAGMTTLDEPGVHRRRCCPTTFDARRVYRIRQSSDFDCTSPAEGADESGVHPIPIASDRVTDVAGHGDTG